VINELRQSGAPDEVIQHYQQAGRHDRLEIHPHNWAALEWFLEVSDCWRWRGQICQGLDWQLVESEARLRGVEHKPDDFQKLKTLAGEARRLINEQLSASR
jgi:hypothetical protein